MRITFVSAITALLILAACGREATDRTGSPRLPRPRTREEARAELARRGIKNHSEGGLIAALRSPAVRRDEAVLSLLIDAGLDPFQFPSDRPSPFLIVAAEGHMRLLEQLLAANVPVDGRGRFRMTALMWAASRGRAQVVRRLLAAGAAVDARDAFGWSPLMFATAAEHRETVQLLLGKGARTDFVTPAGWSAPFIARIRRNPQLAALAGSALPAALPPKESQALGDLTIQPGALDFGTVTPGTLPSLTMTVTLAAGRPPQTLRLRVAEPFRAMPETVELIAGEPRTVTLVLTAPTMSERIERELTFDTSPRELGRMNVRAEVAVGAAAKPAHLPPYADFLQRGGDRASREEFLSVSFWQAVRSGDADVAGALIDAGQDPDRIVDDPTIGRTTPLIHAIKKEDVHMVRTLLLHGASTSFRLTEDELWNQNHSPLASLYGIEKPAAQLLLQAGARE